MKKSLVLILFISIFAVSLLSPTKALAAFSDIPTKLSALGTQYDSSSHAIIHLSTQSGGSNGAGGRLPSVTVKIYTTQTNTALLTDNDRRVQVNIGTLGDNYCRLQLQDRSGNEIQTRNCNEKAADDTLDYYVPKSYFDTSNGARVQDCGPSLTCKVVTLKILLASNDDVLDIQSVNTFSGTKIGFAGSTFVPIDTNNVGSPDDYWSYNVRFGVPCDVETPYNSVHWKDDDYGLQPENYGKDITVKVFNTRSPFNKVGDATSGDFAGGGGGAQHEASMNATLNTAEDYRIEFDKVNTGNTISVKYPYDSAEAWIDCTSVSANSWQAQWRGSTGVYKDNTAYLGTEVGDVTQPEGGDAPWVGNHYYYQFNAKNSGNLPISNVYYDRACNRDSSDGRNQCDSVAPVHYWTDNAHTYERYQAVPGITTGAPTSPPHSNFNIAFDGDWPGQGSHTYQYAGNTTAAGGYIHLQNWSVYDFAVGKNQGGTSQCAHASLWPSYGTADIRDVKPGVSEVSSWDIGTTASRAYAPELCVNIPWYYTLSSTMAVSGATSSTIQQGQALTATGTITNPENDGAGRKNTNSISRDTGILQLKLDSGQPIISNTASVPNTANYAIDPCAHMQSRAAGLGSCSFQDNADRSVDGGSSVSLSGGSNVAATSNYAVGTKLCYVAYAKHPRNTTNTEYTSGDNYYTYSNIDCTTIVKAPKVHFQNTDLTVGRHRSTVSNPCSDPISAEIRTSGAPAIKDDQLAGNGNMYGSWVEYGAFATAAISNFGSAAVPQGFVNNAIVQPQRLAFGNDGALGNFAAYGQTLNCLPNPFEDVNDSNTTDLEHLPTADAQNSFETSGANKGNLYLNELAEKTTTADDKKGFIAKGSNIKLTPRSPTAYTANVSVEAKPHLYGADCPQLNVQIFVSGVVTDSEPIDYCNGAAYETKTVTLNLGTVGYGGPSKVRIEYVNDAWVGGDRNIEVRNVNVKFNNNNTQQSHNVKDLPISNRVYDTSYAAKQCEGPSVVTPDNGLMFFQSSASSAVGANGACYGVEIFRSPDLAAIASMPPPPSQLNPSYAGFQARDMVLYAKKADPTKKCTDIANATSGNIVIDQDIIYQRTGFNSVLQLPRLVFVADCSITISDAVKEVDASLIAGDAIKTCSAQRKTKDECNQNLIVRGGISANRLLLWRTFGADLQSDDGQGTPAENFDLSPSQMIAHYKRGLRSATFSTTDEVDLPPRY